MRALSLTQPYATLIALGAKTIETRSWATSYRGPLAIHAAKGLGPVGGKRGLLNLISQQAFSAALLRAGITMTYQLPRGAIVAVCRLVDCRATDRKSGLIQPDGQQWHIPPGEPERAFGDYTSGRFAWLLADIRALPEPVPCRGALGLWELDAATLAAVEGQL